MGLLTKLTRPLLIYGAPQLIQIPACPPEPLYNLDDSTLIGKGAVRECHQHPDDSDLCIKITCDIANERKRGQNNLENYLNNVLHNRGVSTRHLPRCHGWVATNFGPGLVLDRVHDLDGQTSLTLRDSLLAGETSESQFWTMFAELRFWAVTEGMPVYDVEIDNMVVRQDGIKPHLVITDCGTKVKFKYVLYGKWPWYASLYTRSHWRKYKQIMREEIARLFANNDAATLPAERISMQERLHARSIKDTCLPECGHRAGADHDSARLRTHDAGSELGQQRRL
ncbi:MAG TPA: YrbL family protein [Salinisphaeraceae bacterium]|nr:YrbL family protein [Salinisphaeraceae bacterium]